MSLAINQKVSGILREHYLLVEAFSLSYFSLLSICPFVSPGTSLVIHVLCSIFIIAAMSGIYSWFLPGIWKCSLWTSEESASCFVFLFFSQTPSTVAISMRLLALYINWDSSSHQILSGSDIQDPTVGSLHRSKKYATPSVAGHLADGHFTKKGKQ